MSERKLALITGGSRGIGRAIGLRLAKDGFDIAFTYSRGAEAALLTKAECEALGAKTAAYQADVTDSAGCAALVKTVYGHFGRIDVLVNNAGVTRDALIMRMSDEDYDTVMNTNARGAFYMLREVSKLMLKARSGHIINISSVVGITGNAGQVNYAASKAAVIGMTKSLARELAGRHINVNAIAPGFIRTDMTDALNENAREAILKSIPFGEMGEPEDVANMAAFLAGEESRYVTGQVFSVCGGMCM